MNSVASVPGLYFTAARPAVEPSPLRSDVAGFIGRTRRGPVCRSADGLICKPIRVEGWREYLRVFGGLAADAVMTYAIRGYFENEGEIAYIIRLAHPSAKEAEAQWQTGKLDDKGNWTDDSPQAFQYTNYRIVASSPGAWANNTRVTIRYRMRGASGLPVVDLSVIAPDEPTEYMTGLSTDTLIEEVAARSQLICLIPAGEKATSSDLSKGPHSLNWEFTLNGGVDAVEPDQTPGKQEYLDAIIKMGDESEVALVAVPGLYDDVKDEADQMEILVRLIEQAEELRDRMVIVDVPTDKEDRENEGLAIKQVQAVLKWVGDLQNENGMDFNARRAAAIYHPRLSVPDPLGGIRRPLRNIPPSGHIAGVISRLDRQRGAHHTPANAPIFEAVDITQRFDPAEQAQCNVAGINLLRCFAGNWLQVWGGRTLSAEQRFIAHRRLIHRLVRAIRRVAEPLVFDINGPEMWLTLARSITTVLLEAWRAGALKGAQPNEAFRVRCDEKLNTPEEQDLGRVHCEIELAPATPMEFILLRVSLSGDGRLEVFES